MKKITKKFIFCFAILSLLASWGCKDEEDRDSLMLSVEKIELQAEQNKANFTINTNAGSWDITNPASEWLSLSRTSGTESEASINLTVSSKTPEFRIDTLVITAGNAKPAELIVSQAAAEFIYTISIDTDDLSFKKAGNNVVLKVTSDAPQWQFTTDSDWLVFEPSSGQKTRLVTITAQPNAVSETRSATITLAGDYAPSIRISATQADSYYPSYNTSPIEANATGMSSNAVELAAKINLGWNLGNTLEAMSNANTGSETAWGNPMTTKALIDFVKESGFNAVRLPCSWNGHMENVDSAKIDTNWLNRVKEVVQYCVDNDMYVLLNIHWDGGWLDGNINGEKQEVTKAKQKAFWEQIATMMRDFDEHVMFASANEPPVNSATEMSILLSYHQAFVDAVRSTGGRNAYRVLVIQGPNTDIDKTIALMSEMPTDQVEGRMMAEVHYYGPWQFCGLTEDANWGKVFYYWGNGYHSTTDLARNPNWDCEEDYMIGEFQKIKTKFVDKEIPVVLGEYGAIRRTSVLTGNALTLHLASRAYWNKYTTQQAIAHGLLPFYWDEGSLENNGFGIIDRKNNKVGDQQLLDALIEGANQ